MKTTTVYKLAGWLWLFASAWDFLVIALGGTLAAGRWSIPLLQGLVALLTFMIAAMEEDLHP